MQIPAGLSAAEFSLILRSIPFAGVEAGDLGGLIQMGKARTLASGEAALTEGDNNPGLLILLSGEMEIYLEQTAPDGGKRPGEVRLAMIKPGACMGEFSLIDQLPSSASARASKESRVFFIGAKDFRKFAFKNTDAGIALYHNLLTETIRKVRGMDRELDMIRLG